MPSARRIALSLGLLLATGVTLAPMTSAQMTSAPMTSAQMAPAAPKPGSRAAEDAHRQDDIAKHRQMARAHEDAAKCLESGEKESVCQERLQAACKGIAVGRYCGMRHGG
jgi:hypothetical protein